MNYRNKTIFDWKDYKRNVVSSVLSLDFMDYLKSKLKTDNIKNVIVRNIDNQLGVVIQYKEDLIYQEVIDVINIFTDQIKCNLKYLSFQEAINGIFIKGRYSYIFKDDFITLEVNKKKIFMLPDSFFQSNLNFLESFYDFFEDCINYSKCNNMLNIGDDGGNISTILSNKFDKIYCHFHCILSMNCLNKMITENKIGNIKYGRNVENLIEYFDDSSKKNTIVFINPGRKGLQTKEQIFLNVKRFKFIIYMACESKAFKKDMEQLNYKILKKQKLKTMPDTKKYHRNYFLELIH